MPTTNVDVDPLMAATDTESPQMDKDAQMKMNMKDTPK